jgi:hypothetical protein
VAAPSYDCASGIGSIDGFNLVSAWLGAVKTETVIVPTPDQTSEGAEVTLTATVNVEGANANALTGDVTFAFESYTASGATDLAWELGTVVIADGTVSSGQVVLSTTVPPGIVKPGNQSVDVVAFYGGDANHLPSTSAKVSLHFAPLSFAIVPAVVTLQPNAPESFATTGGVPPVRWFITADTTATFTGNSYESSSIGEGDGGFVAGPTAGYVEIQALDSFGAGIHDTGAHEAGHVARDASIADAGHPHDALSDHGTDAEDVPEAGGAGCTCELAKGRSGSGDSSRLAFVGVACGLILVARRRHVRR